MQYRSISDCVGPCKIPSTYMYMYMYTCTCTCTCTCYMYALTHNGLGVRTCCLCPDLFPTTAKLPPRKQDPPGFRKYN